MRDRRRRRPGPGGRRGCGRGRWPRPPMVPPTPDQSRCRPRVISITGSSTNSGGRCGQGGEAQRQQRLERPGPGPGAPTPPRRRTAPPGARPAPRAGPVGAARHVRAQLVVLLGPRPEVPLPPVVARARGPALAGGHLRLARRADPLGRRRHGHPQREVVALPGLRVPQDGPRLVGHLHPVGVVGLDRRRLVEVEVGVVDAGRVQVGLSDLLDRRTHAHAEGVVERHRSVAPGRKRRGQVAERAQVDHGGPIVRVVPVESPGWARPLMVSSCRQARMGP